MHAGAIAAYSGGAYIQQEIGFDYWFLVPLISMLVGIIIFNLRFYWFINVGAIAAYSGGEYVQTSDL